MHSEGHTRVQPIRAAGRLGLNQRVVGLDEQIGAPPFQGWVRTLRDTLGMSTFELGVRMGISSRRCCNPSRERPGEPYGSAHVRAPPKRSCRLFYVLVPTESLNDIVRRRA